MWGVVVVVMGDASGRKGVRAVFSVILFLDREAAHSLKDARFISNGNEQGEKSRALGERDC